MQLAAARAARNILKHLRQTYSGQAQGRKPVQEKDFRHLELAAYRDFYAELEGRGFRLLADFEVTGIARTPGAVVLPTFTRAMVSADGMTVCSYYQVKHRRLRSLLRLWFGLMDMRGESARAEYRAAKTTRHCLDVTAHFSGGSLTASNDGAAGKIANPPGIEALHFSGDISVAALLAAHAQRLQEMRAENPGLELTAVSTAEELFRLQDAEAAQKAAYRKSVNWVTRDELLEIAGGNEAFADAVYEQVRQQLAAEAEG